MRPPVCDWSFDPKAAPAGTRLMVWAGGPRFMTKDEYGQWRNIMGAPRQAPTAWTLLPEGPARPAISSSGGQAARPRSS